jgi:hypothetical protein
MTVLVHLLIVKRNTSQELINHAPAKSSKESLLPFISQIPQVGTQAAENLALELFRIWMHNHPSLL